MTSDRGRQAAWGGVIVMLLGLVALAAQAASPAFWLVSTQDDFLRGEVENVSIDTAGQLRLSPATELVYETTAPFLWTAVGAGDTLWVGSGNDGKVYAVSSAGRGREVFDADALNVHAVAPSGDDTAYVASSPNGAVYEVSLGDAPPRLVFDPDEQYIWALAVDRVTADLYVGTGEPGRVYRVDPTGESELLYDTETTHVLALAFDGDGELLAGTASPGRVFRIGSNRRGFVLIDSPLAEVRDLTVASDGTAYAVAVGSSTGTSRATPAPSPTPATGTPTVTTSATVTAVVTTVTPSPPTPTSSATEGASASAGGGVVYRIQPDGVWDTVWESTGDAPYDVAFPGGDDGGVLIATGNDGKIFYVFDEPPRVALLTRAPAQQVTGLVTMADGSQYYVTANPGKVHRLAATRATQGTFTSEVRDAGTVATWGTVRWRAVTPPGTAVTVSSRSGNTKTPNDTWSPWSPPYTSGAGSPITSPKARYIQWRAELTGSEDSPTLLSVTTAYLPRNLRPRIANLTVHEPGVVFQQPFSGTDPPIAGLGASAEARAASTNGGNGDSQQNSLGRRVFRKGLQTFVWTASDGNQDELQFDVLYRRESETAWRPLTEGTRETLFTWDTTSTPDGTYFIRVMATDALSNAPEEAMTTAYDSVPFDVDNSPPRVMLEPTSRPGLVSFRVEDTHSPIQRVEYSYDTERWQVVYPIDGIPDSRIERFEVETESADALVIRASDAMDNTVTASGR